MSGLLYMEHAYMGPIALSAGMSTIAEWSGRKRMACCRRMARYATRMVGTTTSRTHQLVGRAVTHTMLSIRYINVPNHSTYKRHCYISMNTQ